MANLTKLYVFVTTAKSKEAGTDSGMRLVFDDGSGRKEFVLGGQPHDERERGRTDFYEFDFPFGRDIEDVRPEHFKIAAAGGDAWLPSSIFIIGKSALAEFKVLVARENWPEEAWLSTDLSDADGRAERARLLDSSATPTVA